MWEKDLCSPVGRASRRVWELSKAQCETRGLRLGNVRTAGEGLNLNKIFKELRAGQEILGQQS